MADSKTVFPFFILIALGGCHRHSSPAPVVAVDAGTIADVAASGIVNLPTDAGADSHADAKADETMPRLPSLSIDGSLVAVRMVDPQGARNDPKVWVGFIDVVVDRVVKNVLIVDPDHPETEGAGQAELLATIKTQKWQALEPLVVHEDRGAPLRHGSDDNPSRARVGSRPQLSCRPAKALNVRPVHLPMKFYDCATAPSARV